MNQVIGKLFKSSPKSHDFSIIWRCGCGKVVTSIKSAFKKKKSCGCKYNNGCLSHGKSLDPKYKVEYKTWKDIKARCKKESGKNALYYSEKGISVCKTWENSFETFFRDMGFRPKGFSIDRIDPNGNYEKDNCRWASNLTQSRNRSYLKRYNYRGEMLLVSEISEITKIKSTTIYERIRRGWSFNQAFGLEDK